MSEQALRARLAELLVRLASQPCETVARELALGLPVKPACPGRHVTPLCVTCEARALELALAAWFQEHV